MCPAPYVELAKWLLVPRPNLVPHSTGCRWKLYWNLYCFHWLIYGAVNEMSFLGSVRFVLANSNLIGFRFDTRSANLVNWTIWNWRAQGQGNPSGHQLMEDVTLDGCSNPQLRTAKIHGQCRGYAYRRSLPRQLSGPETSSLGQEMQAPVCVCVGGHWT